MEDFIISILSEPTVVNFLVNYFVQPLLNFVFEKIFKKVKKYFKHIFKKCKKKVMKSYKLKLIFSLSYELLALGGVFTAKPSLDVVFLHYV